MPDNTSTQNSFDICKRIEIKEKFEDTIWVIRSQKMKKGRRYNGQTKGTKYDQQNTTRKLKIEQPRLNPGMQF